MQEGGEAKRRRAGNVIEDQLCGKAIILLDGLLLPAILYSALEICPGKM